MPKPKGKKRSAATREKIAQANRRRWSDPKYRARLSKSQKKSWEDPEIRRSRVEPRVGQKRSAETRRKMSESQKKIDRSRPDMRKVQAMNEARRGSTNTPEQNAKISEAKKQWHADNPERSQEIISKATKANRYFDNKLELQTAAILDDRGLAYEKQGRVKDLKKPHSFHKWDFVLPEDRILIEVDGCYWHGCEEHHPDRARADLDLMEMLRDAEAELSDWTVLRFWEHELRDRPAEVAAAVQEAVERRRAFVA